MCCGVRTSSTAAHKAQVVESGYLVLDGGRGVAELSWVVLVVSGHHCYQSAIRDVAQGDHLVTWWMKGGAEMGKLTDPSSHSFTLNYLLIIDYLISVLGSWTTVPIMPKSKILVLIGSHSLNIHYHRYLTKQAVFNNNERCTCPCKDHTHSHLQAAQQAHDHTLVYWSLSSSTRPWPIRQ